MVQLQHRVHHITLTCVTSHHKIKVAEKTEYAEGFKALSLFHTVTVTAIFKG